ncbi:SCP2 sterol-binding domain-containing protein [Thetidibacter halocola]|uniref:SCP2 sterol-binding domain-containing protein n=1 Tax=Thetidibacter halocola TaxID=2827239 RepID=A0A8J8BBT9_9RHOB|nr:SCP2 sterol-binding domain-containing protein [Thetidibacter halocola]MBS0126573.1 SCP2 sterol-binding domain-containing protein [Thetidibacter halocola]
MSDTLNAAVAALNEKMAGAGFDGTARFVMGDEGSFIVDETGARLGDDEADVTLSADVDTFQQIFEGALNPTSAFMSGKLTIDGDMGAAMRLAQVLA